ncbi:MAG: SRPBCC domain-containing protein [Bacteroidetes bacterium]|nr:SRPBCC domain-containing protein [Bacteroidota bacterium]
MKHLETIIEINAPIEKVWEILMDFNRYPEWNPFIQVAGKAVVGSHLVNTMTVEGMKPQVFKPKVLVVDEAREFRWLGKLFLKGLFDGEHYFRLEKISSHKTVLHHGEQFRGILVRLLWGMISGKTQKGFESMNAALKLRCEE